MAMLDEVQTSFAPNVLFFIPFVLGVEPDYLLDSKVFFQSCLDPSP